KDLTDRRLIGPKAIRQALVDDRALASAALVRRDVSPCEFCYAQRLQIAGTDIVQARLMRFLRIRAGGRHPRAGRGLRSPAIGDIPHSRNARKRAAYRAICGDGGSLLRARQQRVYCDQEKVVRTEAKLTTSCKGNGLK